MKSKLKGKLAIFDTFKTKDNELTGEAKRQRAIITILGSDVNPIERTRTGISQKIAKNHQIAWKNIYSGIFRDLDEILLPMEIAEEDGRLPLKRGPKALQEKGIPYYHLTKKGVLVGLAINGIENMPLQLKEFFSKSVPEEEEFEKILTKFMTTSPNFTYSIFQRYVKAFCENKINELLPFDLAKLRDISDENLIIQKEMLVAFQKFTTQEKNEAVTFLEKII
ncbi:MAG: hypothetical protein MT332_01845 [Candidatus Nitrosopumilus limneticus]|nr:hypothetical protein [Candidatus Nitrosopumilus limneticus]MDC4212080.1 hypothetical protein [Candidatus Nitrosopumilus limneticus]MDC4214523.1 hypothetical protein [Candidatus Nitrosopumilus limneticus]MDC4216105.1 hypothetical protein [Candidatus Nitrosopumilus limneticus]MDC4219745.1 hypothetical protein [Candidatus Nitrosopumilus limneticus]